MKHEANGERGKKNDQLVCSILSVSFHEDLFQVHSHFATTRFGGRKMSSGKGKKIWLFTLLNEKKQKRDDKASRSRIEPGKVGLSKKETQKLSRLRKIDRKGRHEMRRENRMKGKNNRTEEWEGTE